MSASAKPLSETGAPVPSLEEGRLRFVFDDERWRVVRWDADRVYREGVGTLSGELSDGGGAPRHEGTKAVDFVGVLDEKILYLIEVKDFRGYRVDNEKRQTRELPLEVGLKVRDTLAGLVGARAKTGAPPWVESFVGVLTGGKQQVRVVVWVADDEVRPNEPRAKRAVRDSERLQRAQQRLAWLTSKVWVEDPLRGRGVPGVDVESLPASVPAASSGVARASAGAGGGAGHSQSMTRRSRKRA
jgi:hypothetical protein